MNQKIMNLANISKILTELYEKCHVTSEEKENKLLCPGGSEAFIAVEPCE